MSYLSAAVRSLAVGEHPDVGCDASVVGHVERPSDDSFQPVVPDDPAPYVAFTLASVAHEEG